MKRKVIQIQVDPRGKIIALADDGSIWIKDDEWVRIKDIPPKVTCENSKGGLNHG